MPIKPHAAKYVRRLTELTGAEQVLKLGRLRPEQVAQIMGLGRHNLDLVLMGERRKHYLAEHREMAQHERELRDVVLNPDEVHRNRKDPSTAIFYRHLGADHYLRVAVVLQRRAGELKHSVFSFRLAKQKEVDEGRRTGRIIWRKK